ncbi:hypothetical protein Hypma_001821 [Hypsizygus marmoreus]|uniref:Hydrophobin n=1 Tax=Hypsizygus marmoreus TaxID=39966 RepID=A0A369JE88_HYPMA|nr:hypothetical protein Hypma_001821 [Hypsizygus marmoreus]
MVALLAAAATMVAIIAASSVPDTYRPCNTSTIKCCQQTFDSDSVSASALLGLIGIPADGLTGQIGTPVPPSLQLGLMVAVTQR